MLDGSRPVETPEGVALALVPAGPVARFLAFAVDFLIRFFAYMAVSALVLPFRSLGLGLLMILVFLVEWFYPVLFELFFNGATPGKKVMGIRVLEESGLPVRLGPSVLRNLLRAADFLPVLYGFGALSMLLTRDFRRLGDLAAGTVVVYGEPKRVQLALPEGPALRPPVNLSLDEQQALVAFAERRPELTPERAEELAAEAAALTRAQPAEGVEKLVAMARWVEGRR